MPERQGGGAVEVVRPPCFHMETRGRLCDASNKHPHNRTARPNDVHARARQMPAMRR